MLLPSVGLVNTGTSRHYSPMSPLRIGQLLEKRGLTAYQLAKQSDGRISRSTAYRLANGEVERLSSETVAALCAVLKCKPGDLFAED